MTAQAQAPVPTRPPAAPLASGGGLSSPAPRARSVTSASTSTTATPQVLRRARSVAVLGVLIVTVASLLATILPTRSFADASADIAHAAALQNASTQITKAEADAAAAVLAGKNGAADLAQFHTTLDSATSVLVLAAAAHPGDASQIATVTTDLSTYGRAVQDAFQSAQAGQADAAATQLINATSPLESGAIGGLNALLVDTQNRIQQSTQPPSVWYVVVGWLGVALVIVAMVMVARRTRRVVNLGLAVTAALLAVIATALGSVTTQQSQYAAMARANLTDSRLGGELRALTYSAHAAETRSLISSDVSTAQLAAWTTIADQGTPLVGEIGSDAITTQWTAYTQAHASLVAAADSAGKLSVLTTQSVPAVAALDTSLTQLIDGSAQNARASLSTSGMVTLAAASGLGAMAAIAFAFAGIRRRLAEYR